MKISTMATTTATDSRLLPTGTAATLSAASTPSQAFSPAADVVQTTPATSLVEVDDGEAEAEQVQVIADENQLPATAATGAAVAAVTDNAVTASAMECTGFLTSDIAGICHELAGVFIEDSAEMEEMEAVIARMLVDVKKEEDVAMDTDEVSENQIDSDVDGASEVDTTVVSESQPTMQAQTLMEEMQETTQLVERRVVVFRPETAIDNDSSSIAPTMAVSARFSETVQAIKDVYVDVTELKVATYFYRLTAKYQAVVDNYYDTLDNATAARVGKNQYPYVFVEDYQTGDNCVFVPKAHVDEVVGLEAMVCLNQITREEVPNHLRLDNIFRGVRRRGRQVGARFTPTPLKPLDPQLLCRVRNVPFTDAAAAAEASKPKADVARFEERLIAREIAHNGE